MSQIFPIRNDNYQVAELNLMPQLPEYTQSLFFISRAAKPIHQLLFVLVVVISCVDNFVFVIALKIAELQNGIAVVSCRVIVHVMRRVAFSAISRFPSVIEFENGIAMLY